MFGSIIESTLDDFQVDFILPNLPDEIINHFFLQETNWYIQSGHKSSSIRWYLYKP